MIAEAIIGSALAAAGGMAYAVRHPSAGIFAPTIARGPSNRKAIALTFDDGPSESTPELLDLLAAHNAKATFFLCGRNAERLGEIAKRIVAEGHEIGNHTYSHPALYLRRRRFLADEIQAAQEALYRTSGVAPALFRPTYGASWFGLRRALDHFQMRNVTWSALGLDWKLPATAIHRRLKSALRPGAILCLHDGRELTAKPDILATIEATRLILPDLLSAGYALVTVSNLICQKTSPNASSK